MSFTPTPEVTALTARLIEPLGAVVAGSRIVREAGLDADERRHLLDVVEMQASVCIDIVHELSLAIRISELEGPGPGGRTAR